MNTLTKPSPVMLESVVWAVPTIAALTAINTASLPDGQQVSVAENGGTYSWDETASVWTRVDSTGDPVTWSIGATGDYDTVNEALSALRSLAPRWDGDSGPRVTLELQSGFEMAEQVFVRDGEDLSWVTITSVDSEVPVVAAAITDSLNENDTGAPVFGADNNATLPVIGALFSYGTTESGKNGVAVFRGSKCQFLPGSGIRFCDNGITVAYKSEAYCYMGGLFSSGATDAGSTIGVTFDNCSGRALQVQYGSSAGLARSVFDGAAGNNAVYVIWNSMADIFQSSVKNFSGGNAAINARDGSIINARETDCSGSANRGYHALHSSRINARYKADAFPGPGGCSGAGGFGILASHNSQIDAQEMNASGCNVACQASDSSSIDFSGGDASNATGDFAIQAASASSIAATLANASGSAGIGVRAFENGTISFDNGDASGAGSHGVVAGRGSRVSCRTTDASGTSGDGFRVENGSILSANNATGSLSQTSNSISSDGIIFQ